MDLSKPIGPATHAANGSLHGVIKMKPADAQTPIAPLHPRMFNNPAVEAQQPVGDAIVVLSYCKANGCLRDRRERKSRGQA